MQIQNYQFPKSLQLRKKSSIDVLFAEPNGKSVHYPLLFLWRQDQDAEQKFLFSVSKKKFPLAVDRNRCKRLMRETVRLNRHLIQASEQLTAHIALVYIGKDQLDLLSIEKAFHGFVKKYS